MKKIFVAASFSLLGMPAYADSFTDSIPGSVSGSAGFTTDYISRGLDQSNGHSAVQGGLTYTIALDDNFSVYAGAWGSSVDFDDDSGATTEVDLLTGVGYAEGDFSLDTGLIFYRYPGADNDLQYYEMQASVGYKIDPFLVRAAVNYSPDNALDSGKATYLKLALEYEATEDLKFTVHGGRQYIENNENFGVPDYNDWGVGAVYKFKGVDLGLDYVQNDLDSAHCGLSCGGKVMFSITKSF